MKWNSPNGESGPCVPGLFLSQIKWLPNHIMHLFIYNAHVFSQVIEINLMSVTTLRGCRNVDTHSSYSSIILYVICSNGPVRFGFFALRPNQTVLNYFRKQKPNQTVYEFPSLWATWTKPFKKKVNQIVKGKVENKPNYLITNLILIIWVKLIKNLNQ